MKNVKKIITMGLITMLTATCFMACGDKKEATPAESTKVFLDLVFKDDKTDMEKVGLSEANYGKFREELENGMMQGFASSGLDSTILTDEVKNQLKDDILKGLTKLEYDVVEVSKEKDTAKVEVKMKGFDMQKIQANAESKLMAAYLAKPTMTQAELFKETFKFVGEELAAGNIVSEPKSVTLTVDKTDGVWLPGESDVMSLMTVLMQE